MLINSIQIEVINKLRISIFLTIKLIYKKVKAIKLMEKKDIDGAMKYYKKTIELSPNDLDAYSKLG